MVGSGEGGAVWSLAACRLIESALPRTPPSTTTTTKSPIAAVCLPAFQMGIFCATHLLLKLKRSFSNFFRIFIWLFLFAGFKKWAQLLAQWRVNEKSETESLGRGDKRSNILSCLVPLWEFFINIFMENVSPKSVLQSKRWKKGNLGANKKCLNLQI